jgi:hypothetical protein
MHSQQEEQMAVELEEIESTKIHLSNKKSKTWQWKEDGVLTSRSQTFAEVYYGDGTNKFNFTLENLRTINGIQTKEKHKSGWMSVNLKAEQSAEIRTKVDDPMFQAAFNSRKKMMKKGNKITHPSEMRMMFQGIVKDGAEKQDGSGQCWEDQVTCTIPLKRKAKQLVLDENECVVEDLDGRPYPWTGIDGKRIREAVIEIERMVFGAEITVRAVYRLIVVDEKARPRVITKRKREKRVSPPAGEVDASETTTTMPLTTEEATVMHKDKKVRTLPIAK